MNNIDKQYQDLLQSILDNGVKKETRNGGTISVFGRQIRHDMKTGFPLITTKKMAWKTMVTELLWFLRGDTNIKYLVDNGCNIWTGDAYKNYCKHFMDEYLEKNELGEFYRNSLRPYPIEEFINKIKTDSEFSEKWGLRIEERELNRLERIQLGLKAGWKPKGYIENFEHEDLDGWNIPTKLIALTYKNEKIESYE
jgi:hypothetical protein